MRWLRPPRPNGRAFWLLLMATLSLAAAPAPFAGNRVERIPVQPSAASARSPLPLPPARGQHHCVDVTRVAAATIVGDRAIEITLRSGKRWRMVFAQGCPTLRFYQGFYYRRARTGRLCAGRDAIIARSGGECQIASIVAVPSAR